MATTFATGYAMILNVTRAKPGEAPKSYEDLLQPRWKGRLVLDNDAHDWFAGMIDRWGKTRPLFLEKAGDRAGFEAQKKPFADHSS